MLRLVGEKPEYLSLVRGKLYLQYLLDALGEKTGKIVIDPKALDGEVEIWLQYPPKISPFSGKASPLLPTDIGAGSTRTE